MPFIDSVADGEQLLAGRQDPPETVHAEAGNSCGRQLDRQGHPVEVRADRSTDFEVVIRQCSGPGRGYACGEEGDRVSTAGSVQREPRDGEDRFTGKQEPGPTRREDR